MTRKWKEKGNWNLRDEGEVRYDMMKRKREEKKNIFILRFF